MSTARERLFGDVIDNPDQRAVLLMDIERQKIEIALAIRAARNAAGLSQIELSEMSGVTQPEISRIEKAKVSPRLETLLILTNFLETQITLGTTPQPVKQLRQRQA